MRRALRTLRPRILTRKVREILEETPVGSLSKKDAASRHDSSRLPRMPFLPSPGGSKMVAVSFLILRHANVRPSRLRRNADKEPSHHFSLICSVASSLHPEFRAPS